MAQPIPPVAFRRTALVVGAIGVAIVLLGTARCAGRSGPASSSTAAVTMRIGIGGLAQQTPQAGLQQFIANLSIEGLIAPYEDGRPRAWLAEGWENAADGSSLTVRLRPQAKFHDGSPVTASVIAQVL